MAKRELILDGLAWAGISEKARIAKICAKLVRSASSHNQTEVKEAIRNTSPPYGRAKHIFAAIWGDDGETGELTRQREIYNRRWKDRTDWENWLKNESKLSTRLNKAYASAFSRPRHLPYRHFPGGWSDYEGRRAWEDQERERDKGDDCIALTHQDGHVVALCVSENGKDHVFIATRLKSGPITKSYIKAKWGSAPRDLVEAAVNLGGPKVRSAIAKGKRVKTDWINRRSFIYHDGSDHEAPKIEMVEWTIADPPMDRG